MEALAKDFRYALRQLRKAPGFTATAVLTLALGIGVTTAIFTLVYDVLLRPLPYREANRLVVMEEVVAEFRDIYPKLPMNANHFENWQRNSRTIESMAMMEDQSMPMGLGGHPLQVDVVSATPGIFSVLRVAPELGRTFTVQEAQPGHEHVVILTNDLWRTEFHSNAGILGQTITLNGFPYSVIGVMLGVYGVVTYSVVQRQREIGLRLALGAQKGNIYRLVLRDGLLPVLAGAAAGIAVSFGFARLVRSLLFEVSPHNPIIAIASVGVLVAIGIAACLLPARRAAAVDPIHALRTE